MTEQRSLFSVAEERQLYSYRCTDVQISPKMLQDWKQRVYRFQQNVLAEQQVPCQGSLFTAAEAAGTYAVDAVDAVDAIATPNSTSDSSSDLTSDPIPSTDLDQIDPFTLRQQNTEFWRWKFDDVGVAALYFVIDYEVPILLYVGETVKSNQRWKGEHDCKRYLVNYRQTHYQLEIPTALSIGFWPHAPAERKPRQQLESALIKKWRSPFNKENWTFWGTPFVGGKA
ncbi:MAG: GIY-YIG nuclease family protein [Thainema sp.]